MLWHTSIRPQASAPRGSVAVSLGRLSGLTCEWVSSDKYRRLGRWRG
jgi:hypothetical protein